MRTKLTTLALCATILLMCVSCGGGQKDPVKTATKYAEAYFDYDLDKCKTLMGEFYEDSDLEMEMELIGKSTRSKLKKIVKADGYKVKYNAGDSEIDDDDAEVWFDITSKAYKDFEDTGYIRLEKVDGKWYVKRVRFDVADETQKKMRKAVGFN